MKLKGQKGATGADIIISITIIVIVVTIASMIYVNTTLQGRNVNRTAGATRIATNIMENIEKMSYNDFVAEYIKDPPTWTSVTEGDYANYKSATETTVFNTKIPKGYTVYLYGEPNYGSHENDSEKFDLVRDIKLSVTYKVGDVIEKIDLATSKTREIIKEVNEPNTSLLTQQKILKRNDKFYPIKYVESVDAYIKTDENDIEWYDYSKKNWAMVVISKKNENELFDINGKLLLYAGGYEIYTWIPRFFYSEETVEGEENSTLEFTEFQHLTTEYSIQEARLKANDDDDTELIYTSFGPQRFNNTTSTDMGNATGKWILAKDENVINKIDDDAYGKILNESIYGPCDFH